MSLLPQASPGERDDCHGPQVPQLPAPPPQAWSSLPATKELPSLSLGPLTSPTMDLLLLQGGVLRRAAHHSHLLLEVTDTLPRHDELGLRVWSHQVHLTSPHLTSPHLISPHLTSPNLTTFQLQDCPERFGSGGGGGASCVLAAHQDF